MNHLESFIRKRKKQKKLLLMTHIICGYPSFEDNLKQLEIMEKFNIDLVEFQFPFSEPIADGPIFSNANRLAIENNVTTDKCLEFIKNIKNKFSFKILMMGYFNTVFSYGYHDFISSLKNYDCSGMIIADLPIEEGKKVYDFADKKDISSIFLMTPTNTKERLKYISRHANGFIYLVAREGITGNKTLLNDKTNKLINICREISTLPIAMGFGISQKKDLRFLENKVDIAIIGTAILKNYLINKEKSLEDFFISLELK